MVNVSNTAREVIVLIEVILCFMITPVCIYYYINFNSLSHSIMIQKRHPRILKMTGILVIYWFSFGGPLMAIAWGQLDRFKGTAQIVLSRLNVCFYPWGTIGIFLTIAWRFWHIYFDLKYSSSQKNSEWEYHLDPDLVKHNFWLTRKKDYGNPAYTKKIVTVCYLVTVLINITVNQAVVGTVHHRTVGTGTATLLHGIIMGVVIGLWLKIPSYSDHFFIRQEVRKIVVYMFATIGFGVCSVAYGIISQNNVLLMMITADVGYLLFLVSSTISFWYIPRKIRNEELNQALAKLTMTDGSSLNSSVNSSNSTPKDLNSPNNQLHIERIVKRISNIDQHNTRINIKDVRRSYKLHCVLSNPQTFKSFINHLAKEFSMECLLCFAEIIQYKFSMLQRFNIVNPDAITETAAFCEQCPLEGVIPLSSINQMFQQNLSKYKFKDDQTYLMNECKAVCLKLFEKYIENGSELEVNVSYEQKSRLVNLMNGKQFWMGFNITPNEVFCLFDGVATTMYRLMNGSYVRFKSRPEYKHVVEILDEFQENIVKRV